MLDREKIIKGLEQFRADLKPFCGNHADWERFDAALNLLKEQEAVEPSTYHHLFICPVCKNTLFREQKFCHECGKRIEWEGL